MEHARRHAWAPIALVALTLTLTLAVVALFWAGDQDRVWPWLRPEAPITAAVAVGLWVLALVTFALPRRRQGRPLLVILLTGLTVVTFIGGLATFVPCSGDVDMVLTPLWRTLRLFTGDPAEAVDTLPTCQSTVPLALQVARTTAIAATFATIGAAAITLWRRQVDRARARHELLSSVVLGLDESTLPVVQRLVAERTDDEGRVAVVLPQGTSPDLLALVDDLDCLVVIADPTHPVLLRGLLTHRSQRQVKRVYVLDPQRTRATSIAAAVSAVLGDAGPESAAPVQVVVRVDDRHHADRLRLELLDTHPGAVFDAVSPTEVTAAELVGRVLRARNRSGENYTDLVVLGDTALAEAVIAEVFRRSGEMRRIAAAAEAQSATHWRAATPEQRAVSDRDLLLVGFGLRRLVVFDEAAADLAEHVVGRNRDPGLDVLGVRGGDSQLREWLTDQPGRRRTAVINTDPQGDAWHRSVRVSDLTGARIWVHTRRSPDGDEDRQVSEFAVSMLFAGTLPDSAWSRMARFSHEVYRRRHFKQPQPDYPQSLPPGRRPWWHADDSLRVPLVMREDNIAQIRGLMDAVASEGYQWRLSAVGDSAGDFRGCWFRVAEREHRRWVRAKERDGWRPGPVVDEDAKLHNQLVPFADLPVEDQEYLIGDLQRLVAALADYGYLFEEVSGEVTGDCARPARGDVADCGCPDPGRAAAPVDPES